MLRPKWIDSLKLQNASSRYDLNMAKAGDHLNGLIEAVCYRQLPMFPISHGSYYGSSVWYASFLGACGVGTSAARHYNIQQDTFRTIARILKNTRDFQSVFLSIRLYEERAKLTQKVEQEMRLRGDF
jgi:hypothetical protein